MLSEARSIMKLILFTREKCPKCPAAKEVVKEIAADMSVDVEAINADNIAEELEYELLENQLFVFSTPTVMIRDDKGKLKKFSTGEIPNPERLRITLGGV